MIKFKSKLGIIIAAALAVIIFYGVMVFNKLVAKEETVNKAWSSVQNVYQRRLDLTPNLVTVVKGMSDFEKTTFENIAEARSKAVAVNNSSMSADNYNKMNAAQNQLAQSTNRMILLVEKYPNLKGTSAYRGLQVQLEGNERRINVERTRFNTAVQDYNTYARSMPSSIFAAMFGFKSKEGFTADSGTDKSIEIKF